MSILIYVNCAAEKSFCHVFCVTVWFSSANVIMQCACYKSIDEDKNLIEFKMFLDL